MPQQSARVMDHNGWYQIKNQPISKVGVFPYLGANIPGAPDPGKMYMVYRPAEELGSPECVDSFKLTPWINDHVLLGAEEKGLTPVEQKGAGGVIGEQVYFDSATDTLYGNLKCWSDAHASMVDAGKVDLSCGYRCKYEWQSGNYKGEPYDVIQRYPRGNHIASVDVGRMGGDVAVLDSVDTQLTFTIDSMEFEKMPDENTDENTPADPVAVDMTLPEIIAFIKSLQPLIPALQALVAPAAPVVATDPVDPVDPVDPAAVAVDTDPVDPAIAMDANDKAFYARLARRDTLGKKLSDFIGTFDWSDKTEQELAVYGVQKLELHCAKGSELATVNGYLQAAKVPTAQPVSFTGDNADANTEAPFFDSQLNPAA